MNTLTLTVPEMSCGHCVTSVSETLGAVPGVGDVRVDLEAKRVEVAGEGLEPRAVAAALREAGYEPVES
ncbi:MAG TPA: heavy-metal-associated domain-containing protein [Solirubrobacterales bacterium]|nr:heavy-metal-associated domain-containing protein [Solirubrobacterales bacterium]